MDDYIAYQKPDGSFVDADVARWIMAIVEIAERRSPGCRDEIIAWLEASKTRVQPAPPELLEKLDNRLRPRPESAPPKFNGGIQCDMDVGPCGCGAWHREGD